MKNYEIKKTAYRTINENMSKKTRNFQFCHKNKQKMLR